MKYIETVKILVLNHIIKHLPVETQQHKQQEKVLNMFYYFFKLTTKKNTVSCIYTMKIPKHEMSDN